MDSCIDTRFDRFGERIFAIPAKRIPHRIKEMPEGALIRLVADETFIVLDLEIVAVNVYAGQSPGAVCGQCSSARPLCHSSTLSSLYRARTPMRSRLELQTGDLVSIHA